MYKRQTFANKYVIEGTIRADGSSRFDPDHRWGWFPGVNAAWRVGEEGFMKRLGWFEDLKVRASYGLVGSDDFNGKAPHFLYQNQIGIGKAYDFWTGLPTNEQKRNGANFEILSIQDAGWEHVKKFDIGVDLSLFNQVNITFDYFHDVRDRILMSRASWPIMLGYWGSTPWSNIGEVTNSGVELSLNWSKQFGKDWACLLYTSPSPRD